jgi:predicted MFS family arabinose efflux permease
MKPIPRQDASPSDPLYTANFLIACVVHFTGSMSGALFILFPLFIAHLGGDELVIGNTIGLGAAAAVASRPIAGHLLDRFGSRRVLLLAGVANVVLCAAFLLLSGRGVGLYVLTVAHAVAVGALFACYFTYATHIVPESRRIEGVAMFGVAGMAPNGLAPPLAEWVIAQSGFRSYFLCAAGFGLVATALVALLEDARGEEHDPAAAAAASPLAGLRLALAPELRVLYLATLLFGFGLAGLFTFLAPFALATGRGGIGSFFFGYALAAIAIRILGARLPERLGPRRILLPALVAYGVGLVLTPYTPGPASLLAVGLVCGTGHGYIFPILSVLVVARTPSAVRGAVVSLYTGMIDLGTTLGGPILGALATGFGFRTMYAGAAAALWLAALAMQIADRPGVVLVRR